LSILATHISGSARNTLDNEELGMEDIEEWDLEEWDLEEWDAGEGPVIQEPNTGIHHLDKVINKFYNI
jgi:hypothetical protein